MLVAKFTLTYALVSAQGLFVEEIFKLPGTDGVRTPTTDNQLNTKEIPTVPDQNLSPPAASDVPNLVQKRVRKFSLFQPELIIGKAAPVPAETEPRIAPVLKATSPIEILYEVSSNGSYSNASKWKLDRVTAQIRRYGELFPVQGVRRQLESMLAKTSPKVQNIPVTIDWIEIIPGAFTQRVYRDLLYQVANATSTVQVDEMLAENQHNFPSVLKKFYDAQARFLTMLEDGNVYIGE